MNPELEGLLPQCPNPVKYKQVETQEIGVSQNILFSRAKKLVAQIGLVTASLLCATNVISNEKEHFSIESAEAMDNIEVQGANNFDNAKIVEAAVAENGKKFATGWGMPGECMVAAQRWANNANGGKNVWNHARNGVISIYQDSGAMEVSLDKLRPGDILQKASAGSDADTNWTYVHTMIFRGYGSSGMVNIVDANRNYDGTVRVTDNYSLYAQKGWQWRAFRMGKASGSSSTSTINGKIPYAAVAEGQEFYSDEGWVYTRTGGAAWPIKYKSNWNDGDTVNWGGKPTGPVDTHEVHDHEVGYSIDGQRQYGAHSPQDGTTVWEETSPQQWYFYKGHAYPIGSGEIDDLGVRNRALRVPAVGRLNDFKYGNLPLDNGSVYRFAGNPRVNQIIQQPDGSKRSFYVNNETVLSCLALTQAKNSIILPQSTQPYLGTTEVSSPAGCEFPPGMVLLGPGGTEQWRVTGNNLNQAYQRRYFPNSLTTYLHTSGNPQYARALSVGAINNVPQGPDMTLPNGIFFIDNDNGEQFKIENGIFRKIPWPEMNQCLGNTNPVHVPGNIVGPIPQGPQMGCTYENRIFHRSDGQAYYIESGRKHPIANPAVRNCISVRYNVGNDVGVSDTTANSYIDSTPAHCPYETEAGLNFVQESGDSTVWLVNPDGTKRHVGKNCVVDPYTTNLKKFRIFSVPKGETAGHTQTIDFYGNPTSCGQLPG
jgi:hypothetical protein